MQHAILGLARSVVGVDPGAAGFGIDYPNARDAEGKVVVDLVLDIRSAAIGREHLDGNFGRSGDDAAFGSADDDDRDVGDAVAVGLYLTRTSTPAQNKPRVCV